MSITKISFAPLCSTLQRAAGAVGGCFMIEFTVEEFLRRWVDPDLSISPGGKFMPHLDLIIRRHGFRIQHFL
jgi:hypothetical protein